MEGELIPREVENDGAALAIVMEADELSDAAGYIAIASPGELEFAAAELRNIVTKKDAIEATFKRLKEPFQKGIDGLRAFFDMPIKRLNAAEAEIKQRINVYQGHEQAKAAEARREISTTREDRVLELQDKAAEAEAASIIAPNEQRAECLAALATEYRRQIDEIEHADAPVGSVPVVPSAAGVSRRSNWKGEIEEDGGIDKLWDAAYKDGTLRNLFKLDESALNNLAKLTKGARKIPGVRFYDKGSVAVRRNPRAV
jgi:hypothetical protein